MMEAKYEQWQRLYIGTNTTDIDGTIREVYFKVGGNTGDVRTIEYKLIK